MDQNDQLVPLWKALTYTCIEKTIQGSSIVLRHFMNTQIDLILYHKMSIVPVSLRLTVFSKYIRYQDLQYFILMLLTKNFGHSKHNIALGVRVLGLELD